MYLPTGAVSCGCIMCLVDTVKRVIGTYAFQIIVSILIYLILNLQGPSCPPSVSLWARWLPRPLCHPGLLLIVIGSWGPLGNLMGILWESRGNLVGISWESRGDRMGISWEFHGNLVGISWESQWNLF